MAKGKIVILGINGHVGHAAAEAFAAAGWQVTGFGRSNRQPVAGVEFVAGDADDVAALKAAIADADVVFNGLNLPYDKWFDGRAEAQLARVIEAMGASGKTMLFPGNVYNYAASETLLTPDTPERPERPRGEIRLRMEAMLKAAAARGAFQTIVVRAGDFFGPGSHNDYLDLLILREAAKGRVALAAHEVPHSWAYLPDLGRAFVAVAERREELAGYEAFHFAGHFVTSGEVFEAIQAVSPKMLTRVPTPWTMLSLLGLAMPLMREIVKMRYLWDNPMRLADPRLEAILGPDFGTPFDEAMGRTVARFFTESRQAA
ncbi:NAD-dependent epimerase/dehydratase family protein [Devosia geojensis]|uniref:NAD-dependent epimerase/dehydratase family protein n=1 Tax=Devosia geojensis TaxID=443610 RepID=UPI000698E9A8|nr:NAD-dependent epimerase/dehydratase family protein [Devosia geojensis]